MTDLTCFLFDHRFTIFSVVEWIGFLLAFAGTVIAVVAFLEARRDKNERRKSSINGRLMLVATKNFRIAWVLGVAQGLDSFRWGFAITQSPTPSQMTPTPQSVLYYIISVVTAAILMYLVVRNYLDYRRVNHYIEEEFRHLQGEK